MAELPCKDIVGVFQDDHSGLGEVSVGGQHWGGNLKWAWVGIEWAWAGAENRKRSGRGSEWAWAV